jgi:glycosyltransferase involved in cell wall biosynthesis
VRTALVHDWLDTWRGGEQVLAELCGMYGDADLFALVDVMPQADRARLGDRHAATSFLQHMPLAGPNFRRWLPLFPRAIESFDVSRYELVISSSHAVAKGVRTHRGQLHVCYCYTPMRYAWDLRDQYLAQAGLDRGVRGWLAGRVLDRLREWDRASSARVDHFVASSRHVAARIQRAYGRASTVIYPPVKVAPAPESAPAPASTAAARGNARRTAGEPSSPLEPFYVTVSQLVPYKRVDLIVEAFRSLPGRRLVVIGDGPARERICALAGPNVRIAGRVPDDERDRLLARATAFVFAAEEDFGIAPLEAQARGTPVIALGRGGALETIRGLDDASPTGVLFSEQSAAAIVEAVRTFEAHRDGIDAAACASNALRFSAARFRDEFGSFVRARLSEFTESRAAA